MRPPSNGRRRTAARQRGGHQQRDVADVVAPDGDGHHGLRAVDRRDLRRDAALAIGEHVGGGRAGEGDVDEVQAELCGDQMRVVAGRPSRPPRRPAAPGRMPGPAAIELPSAT